MAIVIVPKANFSAFILRKVKHTIHLFSSPNLPYKILHKAVYRHQRVIVQENLRLYHGQRGHWHHVLYDGGKRQRQRTTGTHAGTKATDSRTGCRTLLLLLVSSCLALAVAAGGRRCRGGCVHLLHSAPSSQRSPPGWICCCFGCQWWTLIFSGFASFSSSLIGFNLFTIAEKLATLDTHDLASGEHFPFFFFLF